MLYLALAQLVVILALVVVLVVRERDHQNERCDAADLARVDRAEHARQIATLCQRLQAPEQAVIDHAVAAIPVSPPAVHPDRDDDYWSAQGISKEDLADAAMRQELRA